MESMEQIYKVHAGTVYGFLLSKTGNPDLAEELTQETFFRAVKASGKFRGDSAVVTWLCGIAKRVWLEYLRKQKKEKTPEEPEGYLAASVEEEVFCQWDNLQIIKAIHHLEDPMREVMYLRLIGNLSFAQIGEIMERSENWARVTFYRGKEKAAREAGL